MNAAADGKLAARSNNPFSAPGTDSAGSAPAEAAQGAVDEGDIEAEGIESALVSLERVTAMLTLNCIQGVSPGMKVWRHCNVFAMLWFFCINCKVWSSSSSSSSLEVLVFAAFDMWCLQFHCELQLPEDKWTRFAVLSAQHVCRQLMLHSLFCECT